MPTYNLGQKYEIKIREILKQQRILPNNLSGNDAGFIHKGKDYFIEVKNKRAPDFGQRGLKWNQENGWEWRIKDEISDLFDEFGAREKINKDFIPRRHTIPQEELTIRDKQYDQEKIKKSGITIDDINPLYEYYAEKDCYYLQIERKGFYYLKKDVANLKVPQFKADLTFRLRAKTHHRSPIYAYSFFAVLNVYTRNITISDYDLEEIVGKFPPIEKNQADIS